MSTKEKKELEDGLYHCSKLELIRLLKRTLYGLTVFDDSCENGDSRVMLATFNELYFKMHNGE